MGASSKGTSSILTVPLLPGGFGPAAAGPVSDAQADILQALVALGYSDKEAALALKALPKDATVSEGIKLALKALAK